MKLLFAYSLRNMLARRLTTGLTAGGMALVVFAFAAIIMLAEGLETTLVDSGSFQNAVVLRKSATSEVQSGVSRREAAIVETQSEIALGRDGQPMVAKEVVVRPEVRLIAGRPPRPGSAEIMVGEGIAQRFQNAGLDGTIAFARSDWRVTGIFDAGNTAFSSEIWGDAEQFMQAFRRQAYSSVILRMRDPDDFSAVKERIEADPRLTCEVKREVTYYREQSELTAKFLRVLGTALTLIFSIGAVVGAMITMYAAVANRTSEIGTLRAVGFRRSAILTAFLVESLLLGAAGGTGGLLLASFLQFFTVSTTNFQTFSELAFRFRLSPAILLEGMLFALLMGLAGGLLPALRAARMNIVEALRAA